MLCKDLTAAVCTSEMHCFRACPRDKRMPGFMERIRKFYQPYRQRRGGLAIQQDRTGGRGLVTGVGDEAETQPRVIMQPFMSKRVKKLTRETPRGGLIRKSEAAQQRRPKASTQAAAAAEAEAEASGGTLEGDLPEEATQVVETPNTQQQQQQGHTRRPERKRERRGGTDSAELQRRIRQRSRKTVEDCIAGVEEENMAVGGGLGLESCENTGRKQENNGYDTEDEDDRVVKWTDPYRI